MLLICENRACYATLPAQAVPSSLSGIKPAGVMLYEKSLFSFGYSPEHGLTSKWLACEPRQKFQVFSDVLDLISTQVCWTGTAIGCFQKLCCDRLLVAAIDSYRGGFMQVYLCDTHTHEDIYIHSILQTEGHAVSCSKADYLEVSAQIS